MVFSHGVGFGREALNVVPIAPVGRPAPSPTMPESPLSGGIDCPAENGSPTSRPCPKLERGMPSNAEPSPDVGESKLGKLKSFGRDESEGSAVASVAL